METLTLIDLFCGAGGFTEGFKKSRGYKTILANDIDYQALQTFKYNHPSVKTLCENISNLTDEYLSDIINISEVDLIIGGPPCQGFSLAGRRLPENPKNQLWTEYLRIVKIIKPTILLFENVEGLVSMQKGLVLETICNELKIMGYDSFYQVLNTSYYGVPQARPRLIIIARNDGGKLEFPKPTHSSKETLNLFGDKLSELVTVSQALNNLPKINQSEGFEEMVFNNPPKNSFQKTISGTRKKNILYNHRATRHSKLIQERYSSLPQGGNGKDLPVKLRTKKNNIHRLDEKKPARTVTCNFRTDLIHPTIPRGLTVREAARLQSFDDDYCFFGNLTRKAKYVTQDDQVGNAVPPLFSKALADHIKEIL